MFHAKYDGYIPMSQFTAGNWPPTRIDHHLASAPKSDWAWEFLRRNNDYKRDEASSLGNMMHLGTIGAGAPVFKLRTHEEAAQKWALCSFRRPDSLGR